MDREVLFGQRLAELKKLARANDNTIDKQTVSELFDELELNSAQMDMVYDYIKKQGITLAQEDGFLTVPLLTGSPLDMERHINDFMPNIKDIARLYEGQGIFIEDLIGEGNLAIYEAVSALSNSPSGDDEKKAFEAYLASSVMESMERALNEDMAQKDIESSVLSRVKRVSEAATELSDALRRKITVEELLREEPELTEEEVRIAIKLSGGTLDVQ